MIVLGDELAHRCDRDCGLRIIDEFYRPTILINTATVLGRVGTVD